MAGTQCFLLCLFLFVCFPTVNSEAAGPGSPCRGLCGFLPPVASTIQGAATEGILGFPLVMSHQQDLDPLGLTGMRLQQMSQGHPRSSYAKAPHSSCISVPQSVLSGPPRGQAHWGSKTSGLRVASVIRLHPHGSSLVLWGLSWTRIRILGPISSWGATAKPDSLFQGPSQAPSSELRASMPTGSYWCRVSDSGFQLLVLTSAPPISQVW